MLPRISAVKACNAARACASSVSVRRVDDHPGDGITTTFEYRHRLVELGSVVVRRSASVDPVPLPYGESHPFAGDHCRSHIETPRIGLYLRRSAASESPEFIGRVHQLIARCDRFRLRCLTAVKSNVKPDALAGLDEGLPVFGARTRKIRSPIRHLIRHSDPPFGPDDRSQVNRRRVVRHIEFCQRAAARLQPAPGRPSRLATVSDAAC